MTALLASTYRSPRHDNKDDPLDELIFIVLSQMTTQPSFSRVYDRLKNLVGNWEGLLRVPLRRLKSAIRDAGLIHQKAPRLKSMVAKIHRDFGCASLTALRGLSNRAAERYLTSLPGVGVKTAKCVMMYSLSRRVLPVDTHVWRVARRLGLVNGRTPYPAVHDALEAAVAPLDRYSFHVNAVAHGRAMCLARLPRCGVCPIRRMCDYAHAHDLPR